MIARIVGTLALGSVPKRKHETNLFSEVERLGK